MTDLEAASGIPGQYLDMPPDQCLAEALMDPGGDKEPVTPACRDEILTRGPGSPFCHAPSLDTIVGPDGTTLAQRCGVRFIKTATGALAMQRGCEVGHTVWEVGEAIGLPVQE